MGLAILLVRIRTLRSVCLAVAGCNDFHSSLHARVSIAGLHFSLRVVLCLFEQYIRLNAAKVSVEALCCERILQVCYIYIGVRCQWILVYTEFRSGNQIILMRRKVPAKKRKLSNGSVGAPISARQNCTRRPNFEPTRCVISIYLEWKVWSALVI